MKLFEKLSDLIRGNVNDVLDKAEDPEVAIKLYIEDATTHYQEMMKACSQVIATEKELQKQYDGLKESTKKWEGHAEAALSAGNEELAKKALAQQTTFEDRMKELEKPLANAVAQSTKMKEDLHTLKLKIDDTKANAAVLIARAKAAKASEKSAETMAKMSGDSPLNKMASMEEKIMASEAHASALNELTEDGNKTLEDEFIHLASSSAVDDKLAKLKEKLAQKS